MIIAPDILSLTRQRGINTIGTHICIQMMAHVDKANGEKSETAGHLFWRQLNLSNMLSIGLGKSPCVVFICWNL